MNYSWNLWCKFVVTTGAVVIDSRALLAGISLLLPLLYFTFHLGWSWDEMRCHCVINAQWIYWPMFQYFRAWRIILNGIGDKCDGIINALADLLAGISIFLHLEDHFERIWQIMPARNKHRVDLWANSPPLTCHFEWNREGRQLHGSVHLRFPNAIYFRNAAAWHCFCNTSPRKLTGFGQLFFHLGRFGGLEHNRIIAHTSTQQQQLVRTMELFLVLCYPVSGAHLQPSSFQLI